MRLEKEDVRRIIIGIVAVISLLLIIKLGSVAIAGYRLYTDYKVFRELAAEGVNLSTLVALDEPLHTADAHFDTLHKRGYGLSKLGRLLGWVPKYGSTLKQAPQLLDLAQISLDAGIEVYDLVMPVVRDAPPDTGILNLVPDVIALLTERQAYMYAQLESIDQYLDALELDTLHPRLSAPLISVKTMLPLAKAGTEVLHRVPDLVGFGDDPDAQRVYMALALNEDELRPGGGFISSIGQITLQNANLVSMEFSDSYSVDNYKEPYPLTPPALEFFMGSQLWTFRDSNWSPDFPTSMNQAIQVYYPKSGERDIHGVVAVDQHAVQALVSAFGKIKLPNQDELVTGDTVVSYMRSAYEPGEADIDGDWWLQRKSFIVDIANTMMHRVMNGDVDWITLGETTMALLNEHHIQVHSLYPDVDVVLAEYGWNGSLRVLAGDYLMVAEANVGYNKSSQLIDRAITYSVDLTGDQPVSRLELNYTHSSTFEIECVPESLYNQTYSEMMHRCSWLYLQTYVPAGATLTGYSEHPLEKQYVITDRSWPGIPVVREPTEVNGATAFEQALLLPTDSQDVVMFEYTLPEDTVVHQHGQYVYRLTLQKQAGLGAVPVKVFLRLPDNAVLFDGYSNWQNIEPGIWFIDTLLKSDVQLEVIYTLDEG